MIRNGPHAREVQQRRYDAGKRGIAASVKRYAAKHGKPTELPIRLKAVIGEWELSSWSWPDRILGDNRTLVGTRTWERGGKTTPAAELVLTRNPDLELSNLEITFHDHPQLGGRTYTVKCFGTAEAKERCAVWLQEQKGRLDVE